MFAKPWTKAVYRYEYAFGITWCFRLSSCGQRCLPAQINTASDLAAILGYAFPNGRHLGWWMIILVGILVRYIAFSTAEPLALFAVLHRMLRSESLCPLFCSQLSGRQPSTPSQGSPDAITSGEHACRWINTLACSDQRRCQHVWAGQDSDSSLDFFSDSTVLDCFTSLQVALWFRWESPINHIITTLNISFLTRFIHWRISIQIFTSERSDKCIY